MHEYRPVADGQHTHDGWLIGSRRRTASRRPPTWQPIHQWPPTGCRSMVTNERPVAVGTARRRLSINSRSVDDCERRPAGGRQRMAGRTMPDCNELHSILASLLHEFCHYILYQFIYIFLLTFIFKIPMNKIHCKTILTLTENRNINNRVFFADSIYSKTIDILK